ncbi:uncharacterized protein LOC129591384 [Paramacrobiotus metropolitanus]|uniref:uncharacterized protein LOC129591384 n=1 Tax=Paramacrobiotus metropolitanus TaxID=2943436 RepID=UPI002445A360|nr:uncharacterized protein LOC129591384 [Paramacrobiotus metropolitanus]
MEHQQTTLRDPPSVKPSSMSFHRVTVPRDGKVLVHNAQSVAPGEILGFCGACVKGLSGTWVESRVIRSALLGTVTVNSRQNENERVIEINVSRRTAETSSINQPSLAFGEIVIAEVMSVDVLEVHCMIRVVGGKVLDNPISAVMHMENIEPLNPHLVELEDQFGARDLILARIMTLDSPVHLDVAGDSKLGVVTSFGPTGCQMIPVGAHEMICPDTFRKFHKRLSTAVLPVVLPARK